MSDEHGINKNILSRKSNRELTHTHTHPNELELHTPPTDLRAQVEDIVRTRLLGVILITTVYVVVAFSAISLVKPGASAPSTIQTSSLFPAVATMRAKLAEIRAPRFRLLDKDRGEFPGASFSVTIAGVYQLQTRGTLDCNTETLNHFSVKDTMEGTRVAAACAPVMAGDQAGRRGRGCLGSSRVHVEHVVC